VRPRLLCPWNRDRRKWFFVLVNDVTFRATVLPQQVRCLKMPLHFWGSQTSSMPFPPRDITTDYKWCTNPTPPRSTEIHPPHLRTPLSHLLRRFSSNPPPECLNPPSSNFCVRILQFTGGGSLLLAHSHSGGITFPGTHSNSNSCFISCSYPCLREKCIVCETCIYSLL
jgi:hypothetical protein